MRRKFRDQRDIADYLGLDRVDKVMETQCLRRAKKVFVRKNGIVSLSIILAT